MNQPSFIPNDRLLFGAAYYPEYFPSSRCEKDLDLMQEANVSVIRVGESVWSTWEPREGEFDVEWLRPTLDGAYARGISVVLGTPTYAVPPWMQKKYPDIAAQNKTGHRVPWGGRQEVDFTAPEFLERAERVIRKIADTYSKHPSVIGFQVDNEPGIHLLHNDRVFARFIAELKQTYETPERLNEEWGLVYWSHKIQSFDELWRPDGNTLPQYDLAWRRFQANLTAEFIEWQANLIREYSSPNQFVTTCVAYSRPAVDDVQMVKTLDVNAANLYYGMQDHLDLGKDLPKIAPWTTTGVWGVIQAADRAYASKQERFLITETNAQAIGASEMNFPPYPGQLRQSALALVSRGASMIEYWHWNTIPYGTETFWGGVLPHSGQPGRIYDEVTQIGKDLLKIGPRLSGYRPDSDITFLYSNASRWAFDFFPPIPNAPSQEHGGAYGEVFSAHYRGALAARRQAAILNDTQAVNMTTKEMVQKHPVLVVPALYVANDELLQQLLDFAKAGGHLVIGMRTGYADEQARSRVSRQPGVLVAQSGTWYEESSNLIQELPLRAAGGFQLPDDARATLWADGLISTNADVLLEYDHPELGRFAALTTTSVGQGQITHLGTVPNESLAAALVEWLTKPKTEWGIKGQPVSAHSGINAAGERIWFLHNWSSLPAMIVVPGTVTDVLCDCDVSGDLEMSPWDVRIFLQR